MNDVVQRYIDINQLLSCGTIPAGRQDIEEKLSSIGRLELTKLEKLFLNFLRVPDYTMALMSNGTSTLFLSQLIEMVRGGELSTDEAYGWGLNMLYEAKATVRKESDINDGVIRMSGDLSNSNADFESAMHRAFTLRCWGCTGPTEEVRNTLQYLDAMFPLSGAMSINADTLDTLVNICVDANIHPADLGKTVLYVRDMRPMLDKFGVAAYWSNFDHQSLTLVLPVGKSSKVTPVKMAPNKFMELYGKDGFVVKQAYVKGGKMYVPDVGRPGEFVEL